MAVTAAALLSALAGCGSGGEPTAPPPAAGAKVVWAVGDAADGGVAAVALASRVKAGPVDRLVYLGDVYESGTAEEFERNYDPLYGELAKVTLPTPGNHDWPNHEDGYGPYWRRAGRDEPLGYYSVSLAGWQLIGLNSEADHARGSPQERWLRGQVARPGDCRIAFWHRPRFSAGSVHGDQPDVEPLWNALRGHAVIVLGGHEHDLQRFPAVDGITQMVVGAGGHSHYPIDGDDDRPVFADDEADGALRLELRAGRADFTFVATDGRRLDSGSVSCRPGP